jgi:hypothetical protein
VSARFYWGVFGWTTFCYPFPQKKKKEKHMAQQNTTEVPSVWSISISLSFASISLSFASISSPPPLLPLSLSCFYGRLVTTWGHYSCGSDIIATQKKKQIKNK